MQFVLWEHFKPMIDDRLELVQQDDWEEIILGSVSQYITQLETCENYQKIHLLQMKICWFLTGHRFFAKINSFSDDILSSTLE